MIGCIEPRSFKDNTNGQENFSQGLFSALRAFFQQRIIKMLLAIKLDTAVLTAVGVYRHRTPQYIGDYSPRVCGLQEELHKMHVSDLLTYPRAAFDNLPLTLQELNGMMLKEGWVGRAIAGSICCLRKVRAPSSTVPGNTRAEQSAERATETNRPSG